MLGQGGFSMSAMPGGRSGLLPAAEADELMPQPQRLHHLPGVVFSRRECVYCGFQLNITLRQYSQ